MAKIISKEDLKNCQSWELPSVDIPAEVVQGGSGNRNPNLLTAVQIEHLQKQAYEEAYAVGLQEGLAAGKEEIHTRLSAFEHLMQALEKPFEQLDDQVDQEIATLVMAMVKQLVRREMKMDPGQVMAVVREALAVLPVSSRNVRLHLHPEDASLVLEFYKLSGDEQTWKIVEDPSVSRGGCKVLSDTSLVDATLETRLGQLFSKAFGGERQQDESSSES